MEFSEWPHWLSIENEKKSCLYALIWDYSFINFQKKVPPICLFSPIFLLILRNFPTYVFIQTRCLFGTLEYSSVLNKWPCRFISCKVCLFASINVKRQTLLETYSVVYLEPWKNINLWWFFVDIGGFLNYLQFWKLVQKQIMDVILRSFQFFWWPWHTWECLSSGLNDLSSKTSSV